MEEYIKEEIDEIDERISNIDEEIKVCIEQIEESKSLIKESEQDRENFLRKRELLVNIKVKYLMQLSPKKKKPLS